MKAARLILEDGQVFEGEVFASGQDAIGEIVFNTAMSGYQEILTDPSYKGQIVLMTYPLIGNYGVNDEDVESRQIFLEGFVVREYIDFPSNYRQKKTLKRYLEENNILGVEGLDTRAVTKLIREAGAKKALLTSSTQSVDQLLKKVKDHPGISHDNLVKTVGMTKAYEWAKPEKQKYRLAVIDCGAKYRIMDQLRVRGCAVSVLPYTVKPEEILAGNYDGLMISNGPGDPKSVDSVVDTVAAVVGKLPVFGICLGHQILGLALGATTSKLKFGHHGANHPIKNLKTGKVEITSQNHGFCIDPNSIGKDVEVTHVNLNDGTVAGIRHRKFPAFSVQYHPEAAPGPHDSRYLFDNFMHDIDVFKGGK